MNNSARVRNILDDLARQARSSNFSSYEAPTDSFEASTYETYLVSQGIDAYTARVVAAKAAQTPAMAAQIKQAMNASGQGLVGLTQHQQPGNSLAAATFNFTVTRPTINIVGEDLPFALFGPQDYANGYRNIIGGLVPLGAGTVLTSVRGGESDGFPDRVVFTYTNGANVDTVVVTCDTYPYPAFLTATLSDLLRLSKVRMTLSDATQTRQFDQALVSVANSPFGKNVTNRVTPSTFKTPAQFQQGIVDIDAVFDMDKETTLAGRILAVANFSISLPMFVEKYNRPIAKGGF